MSLALPLVLALALPGAPTPDTALVTFESGVPVAVNWIQRRGANVRSLSILMQSGIRDATFTLGDSAAVVHASTAVATPGQAPDPPVERAFGDGVVYWSDQIPSSIEQAVLRARALGRTNVRITGLSLYRDSSTPIGIDRIDATDWVVNCNHKRYEVLTDTLGRLIAATLPEYGVTIERRIGFTPDRYPLWPPNAAAPGAPYRARDVRIRAPQGHVLAGTLTVPDGRGPFAAVVLITGLSPHERNNGSPPWMPLRDIADALSRHGVAVLRVDDRGVGKSTGDHASSTTFDEADDVRTELAWLRAQPAIDRRRTALVGYSEGGLIAPMVAASDSVLAGIVTLAGPGVPGPEVARYQIEAAVVRDSSIAPADREAEIARQLADTLTVRERSYMGIDPLAYARRVRCPALVLHGGNDLSVPPRSAERIAAAIRDGGNRDVVVRVFPGISHAFLPDIVGLPAGWAALPGFLTSPDVLRSITDWATQHLAPQHPRATAARGH